jgi:hypothetical protein
MIVVDMEGMIYALVIYLMYVNIFVYHRKCYLMDNLFRLRLCGLQLSVFAKSRQGKNMSATLKYKLLVDISLLVYRYMTFTKSEIVPL